MFVYLMIQDTKKKKKKRKSILGMIQDLTTILLSNFSIIQCLLQILFLVCSCFLDYHCKPCSQFELNSYIYILFMS